MTEEAHFSRKYFVRRSDLSMGNNSCHLDSLRLADACAYLDHRLEHHSDEVEWSVHSIRSVSFGCHSELESVLSRTQALHLNDHYRTIRAVMLGPINVYRNATIVVAELVVRFHVDCIPNVWLIYCPTNKVSNLNALMAVDMHSVSRLMSSFQVYRQPIAVSGMIWKSSL